MMMMTLMTMMTMMMILMVMTMLVTIASMAVGTVATCSPFRLSNLSCLRASDPPESGWLCAGMFQPLRGIRDAGFEGRVGRLSAPSRLHGTGRPGYCSDKALPSWGLQFVLVSS